MHYRYWTGTGASIVLGLIFLTAGLGKLLQQTETFKIFYTPPISMLTPALAHSISIWLPSIELIIGLLLILGIAAKLTASFSSALIASLIANNSWLLAQGLGQDSCDCFGIWETIFMCELSTTGPLYLDITMLALAFVAIFFYPRNVINVRPWFLGKGKSNNGSISKETAQVA